MAIKQTIPQDLARYMRSDNIAPLLDSDLVTKIGVKASGFAAIDKESNQEWLDVYEKGKKLLDNTNERKTYPWDGASNVIIPILQAAVIQFNSRTNPEIIKGEDVVKIANMKVNPTKEEAKRAKRLSAHMSYQLVGVDPTWRRDTDKLISNVGLAGTSFRKTYYDPIDDSPKSIMCLPEDVYVNKSVSCLKTASRITHKYTLSLNEIWSRMKAGVFTDYKIEELTRQKDEEKIDMDDDQDIEEQHCYLDLDEDGYKEPYIVIYHKKTQKVLRIVARYDENSFVYKNNKMIKINPIQYFTAYHFIPDAAGGFWSVGLAALLYHLNFAGNSMLNNLVDAASLQNLGGGFISTRARVKKREVKRRIGEYVAINVPSGSSMRDNIYDAPAANPSPILFQLLGFVNEKAQDVSNVNNLMLGQMPGPNVQPTTVMTLLEQGGKVYSSILTRLYYSFQEEYKKLFDLNKKYLDEYNEFYFQKEAGEVSREDYEADNYGIFPVLDPNMDSQAKRLMQSQALQNIKQDPGVSVYEINKRMLDAMQVQDIDDILPPPPTKEEQEKMPPSFEEKMQEEQLEQATLQNELLAAERNQIIKSGEMEEARLELEEQKIKVDQDKVKVSALTAAGNTLEKRIDSAIALDTAEAAFGKQSVEMALDTVERMSAIPAANPGDDAQQEGQEPDQQQPQDNLPAAAPAGDMQPPEGAPPDDMPPQQQDQMPQPQEDATQ